MRKKMVSLFLVGTLIMSSFSSVGIFAEQSKDSYNSEEIGKVIAFPGAEGGGMYTLGARGAIEDGSQMEVYHVTNLNDSGEGSFRDAVSEGNRIVVFDVSGNIDLNSNVTIGKGNMTILGQTAPGDGICFRGNNIKVSGENVILRYLRFRVGSKNSSGSDTRAQDGLEITDNSKNIIIDHCSVSWGTDENLSAYAVKDVTIQWSIVAEALNQSVHDKGEHSYGAIWGGVNLSVHHNIIATHKSRNPKIGTSETVAMTAGYRDDQTLVDIRNNIIYNWGDKAGYGAENGAEVNIINNYYKPGPATPSGKRARIFEYSPGNKYEANWSGKVYAEGNKIGVDDSDPDKSTADIVNADNYQPELKSGVYPDPKYPDLKYQNLSAPNETYISDYPIYTQSADDAYNSVLEGAGARLPKTDIIDTRILDNIKNRTAPTGSKGSTGLVDDPIDGVPEGDKALYDDRGYPVWQSVSRASTYDSDGDGIADEWENKMGLDKTNSNDSLNIGPDGYTWLEIFVEEELTKNSKDSDTLPSATLNISDTKVIQGDNVNLSVQPASGSDIQKVEFYCDEKIVGQADGGTYTTSVDNLKTGENYITAKVYNSKGEYSFTPVKTVYVLGSQTDSEWNVSDSNATYDGSEFVIYAENGSSSTISKKNISSDFNFSVSLSEYSNVIDGVETGAFIEGDVSKLSVYKTFENNKLVIKTKNGETVSNVEVDDVYNTDLIKITKNGSEIKVFVAKTFANWIEAASIPLSDISTGTVSVGIYTTAPQNATTVSKFTSLRIVEGENMTTPNVKFENVVKNQRLDFKYDLEITVTPDSKSGIVETAVFLDNNLITDIIYDEPITEQKKLTVPLSFSSVSSGVLRIVVFDGNLGMAEESVSVSVSGDVSPWLITDIGKAENDMASYVSVTDDYTYKISAPNGNISGTADKYGYLYQQFNDNIRIYYRSRVQASKNFGIMFKDDLSNDGISYFFGIEPSANGYAYVLKARESKGSEYVTKQTFDNISGDNNYFIAEKIGSKIYIYSTPSGNDTIYKTKTLLGSVDTVLGDSYYMGFAATEGIPDLGWTAIETPSDFSQYTYDWNMDYGLDFYWQMQNSKILAPKWDSEAVSGNETGKMYLSTNADYSQSSYIFREFGMGDTVLESGVIENGFDVLLVGDKAAIDFYLQTKSGNKAVKVGFNDEEQFVIGENIIPDINYSKYKWYRIKITTEIGSEYADVTVSDTDGNVIATLDDVAVTSFETVNNFKKQAITKAFYINPAKDVTANYYIDNMYVRFNKMGTLLSLIKKAEALNESEYSAKTWINLEKAMKDAKEVSDNEYASEDEIYVALNALSLAIENLKPIMEQNVVKTKLWSFGDQAFLDIQPTIGTAQTVDGLQLTGGFTELSGSNKSFNDGTKFSYRLKSGGGGSASKKSFKFSVDGSSLIKIYAESASGSATRKVTVDYGNGKSESKDLVGGTYIMQQFEYTGTEPTTITVYGTEGLNYFGIYYETYEIIDNTTKVVSYNSSTGDLELFNGSKYTDIVVGVASYDVAGKLIDIKKQSVNIPVEESKQINIGTLNNESAAEVKVFVWESLDSMKPLCAPYTI